MGNVLAQPLKLQPEHLAELPNVVLKDTLGAWVNVGGKGFLCLCSGVLLCIVREPRESLAGTPLYIQCRGF